MRAIARARAAAFEARPYQGEDARKIFAALLLSAHRSALYHLATAGGKTVVATEVVKAVRASGGRVLFVVHRRELVDQAIRSFVRAGIAADDIGAISASSSRVPRPDAPIQVAMLQTLSRRTECPPADLVVIDEAHHAKAATYLALRERYANAALLGLTATPYTAKGEDLSDVFHTVVRGPTKLELIEGGYLIAPRTFGPERLPDVSRVPKRAGDYAARELEGIRLNPRS